MPARVFAVEPLAMVSVLSLKLPLKRLLTVEPAGVDASSFTAASVDVPDATGASLIGFTVTVTVAVSAAPPLVTV